MTKQNELKKRSAVIWGIVIGMIAILLVQAIISLQLAKLVKQGKDVSAQNQNYIRCLASVFVESQNRKVASIDLDHCTATTAENPAPTPVPQVPLTNSGVTVPPRGSTGPQNGTQSPPQPTPKSCTVNVLGICI